MLFSSWLRNRTTTPRANRAAALRQRPARFRPALELLEDRLVPSTLTVTNTLDSGAGSLRADVTAAHKGDTIVFNIPKSDPGYNAGTGVWTITLTSGELLIKQDLTITGPGASQLTISGDNLSRVFELSIKTKPQDSLSGMTITNGNGQIGGTGGAINNNGTLTISNCTLSGNSVATGFVGAGFGGAINNNGTLTISNSVLSGNSAGVGGAISNYGPLTVTGCILTGNFVTPGGDGGAINNRYSGVVTVSGSTLSDKSAVGGSGGGIWNNPDSTLKLSGCTLYGNSAAKGGAIFAGGYSTVDLNGCTLTDNSASMGGAIFILNYDTVTLSGCVVGPATVAGIPLPLPGNSAAFVGGGIFIEGGTLKVTNSSKITGNTAPAGQGADVANDYNFGTVSVDASSIIGILEEVMT
jgi:hypothetical protein